MPRVFGDFRYPKSSELISFHFFSFLHWGICRNYYLLSTESTNLSSVLELQASSPSYLLPNLRDGLLAQKCMLVCIILLLQFNKLYDAQLKLYMSFYCSKFLQNVLKRQDLDAAKSPER